MLTSRRKKYKIFVCSCVLLFIYYFFGVTDHLFSRSYEKEFDYPLNVDIRPLIEEVMMGRKPSISPINFYPYRFLTNSGKCNMMDKLDLFIVIKSAMDHFDHRMAIRRTFGQENLLPGREIKSLFFLGKSDSAKSDIQLKINEEMAQFKDIIQMDFKDSYYNNTIKTMMSFRWLFEHCSTADNYLFTDDDFYISVSNLLNYVYEINTTESEETNEKEIEKGKERDKHIYAGYVFTESVPQRHRSSKWRVPLEEYEWNKWPSYVTAGAFVLSNRSMKTMYVGSLFVKHFRFDDIYLGLIARKVGITPLHCPHFYFYKKKYSKEGYRDVIASHGFADHEELVRVWNEQNNIV